MVKIINYILRAVEMIWALFVCYINHTDFNTPILTWFENCRNAKERSGGIAWNEFLAIMKYIGFRYLRWDANAEEYFRYTKLVDMTPFIPENQGLYTEDDWSDLINKVYGLHHKYMDQSQAFQANNNTQQENSIKDITKHVLSYEDLQGMNIKELERLLCYIYAKNGYDFNVNDGLYFLPKLSLKLSSLFEDGNFKVNSKELPAYSSRLGCSIEQLVMVLEASEYFSPNSENRVCLEAMTEIEKNGLRDNLEYIVFADVRRLFDGPFMIGYFNRDGVYGHEGKYYYDFREFDWYNPITSDFNEVYNSLSDIEKNNIELIRAYAENPQQAQPNQTQEEPVYDQGEVDSRQEDLSDELEEPAQRNTFDYKETEPNSSIQTSNIIQQEDQTIYVTPNEDSSQKLRWIIIALLITIVVILIVGGFIVYNLISKDNPSYEPERQEVVENVATEDIIEEAPKSELDFLNQFYKGDYENDDYVKKHVTAYVMNKLKRDYDYDCESNDCLATWVFTAYPPGADYDLEQGPIISAMDVEHIYKVDFNYSYYYGEQKKYVTRTVILAITEEAGKYFISDYTVREDSDVEEAEESEEEFDEDAMMDNLARRNLEANGLSEDGEE